MARGSMDFDQFTDKMNELLKRAWGEDWGEFVHREPTGNDPDSLQLPLIAYDTVKRVRSKSHPSIKPIKFDDYPDPDNPGTFLDVRRQWFDVQMVFYFYHKTNREARILMEDFESFIEEYDVYFKEVGLSEIVFESEDNPIVEQMWGLETPRRQMTYLVRIERIKLNRSKSMNNVDTEVRSKPEGRMLHSTKANAAIMQNHRDQTRLEN